MAEYQQKRWRCDFCGADVKRSVMPPRGWHEIGGFYGNYAHCCPADACVEKAIEFCGQNGFEVPETIAEALKRP